MVEMQDARLTEEERKEYIEVGSKGTVIVDPIGLSEAATEKAVRWVEEWLGKVHATNVDNLTTDDCELHCLTYLWLEFRSLMEKKSDLS